MASNDTKYSIAIIDDLYSIDAEQWDAMNDGRQAFLSHAFLSGLEKTDCVCEKTGWLAQHIVIYADTSRTKLIAAMPCYLKVHSYGEYIFDWSWAEAYQRAGLDYYPKLSCATPFTPATASKWLIHPDYKTENLEQQLIHALKQHANDIKVSSIHALFTDESANAEFQEHGFIQRLSSQFHWHNSSSERTELSKKNQSIEHSQSSEYKNTFSSFNEYLQTMSSRKRKNVKRERKSVVEQGVTFRWYTGDQLNESIAKQIFTFYLSTVYRYGAQQYLTEDFFKHFVKTIPNMTHVLIAYVDSTPIAGSLFFSSETTLYGRYWGANTDIKDLHFETCYYQPIEYAIQQNFAHFEAGAQGEHKLARGLLPVTTTSQHWLANKQFHSAVNDFVKVEANNIKNYHQSITKFGPFKSPEGELKTEI